MLIFDAFPDRSAATAFAKAVKEKMQLRANVYDSQEVSNRVDPFPFALVPPIVLVERTMGDRDEVVEEMVVEFGGSFAGT